MRAKLQTNEIQSTSQPEQYLTHRRPLTRLFHPLLCAKSFHVLWKKSNPFQPLISIPRIHPNRLLPVSPFLFSPQLFISIFSRSAVHFLILSTTARGRIHWGLWAVEPSRAVSHVLSKTDERIGVGTGCLGSKPAWQSTMSSVPDTYPSPRRCFCSKSREQDIQASNIGLSRMTATALAALEVV